MADDRDVLLKRIEQLELAVRTLEGVRNPKGRLLKSQRVLDRAGIQRRIRVAMTAGGIKTQKDLSQRCGVDQGQLSRLLTGKRLGSVTAETLVRLALSLNVYVGWLIAGEGEPSAPPGPGIGGDSGQ